MQTLNVGTGRTDEEYRAAEERRRADSLRDANYFSGPPVWPQSLVDCFRSD
jgi:hypothetical protein